MNTVEEGECEWGLAKKDDARGDEWYSATN